MIVMKFTILLTMVCALLIFKMRGWAKRYPLEALVENYPIWFYVAVLIIYLDVICIFISTFWFLFCYL